MPVPSIALHLALGLSSRPFFSAFSPGFPCALLLDTSCFLGFASTVLLWQLHLAPRSPPRSDSPSTCMRGSTDDPEVVELDIQFSGLSITVRGPPTTAASFVQQVTSGNHGQDSEARPAPSSAPSSEEPPRSSVRSRPTSTRVGESRASVEASFDSCPSTWIGAAGSRLSGSRLSPTERAQRAWKAGQWARAVRQGRVSSPNRTETIDLPNRIWCVVRGPQGGDPRVFHSSRDFFSYVGDLSQSHTLCHAWPSETEAKIYFEGAGVIFPSA